MPLPAPFPVGLGDPPLILLLLARPAHALDAHGAAIVPAPGGDPGAPLLVWEAGAPPSGGGVVVEGARTLAVSWPTDDAPEKTVLLDELGGFSVAGAVRFGRVGVAASLPLWQHYVGRDGGVTGLIPGDLRLAVPVTLWRSDAGLALGVRADGAAPTGDEAALLGGGWSGGVHATAGRGGTGLRWSIDAGLAGDTDAALGNVDRTVTLPLGAQFGYGGERFGGGLEAWWAPSLSATDTPLSSAPGELLARVGMQTRTGFSVTLAVGHAITPGIGGSGGRVLARLGWSAPPKRAAAPASVAPEPGPFDLVVEARDAAGAPVDARVVVARVGGVGAGVGDGTAGEGAATTGGTGDGGGAVQEASLGPDGTATLPLGPGAWTVTISAPDIGTQTRTITLAEDAWRPTEVSAVLQPEEGGTADLTVRLVDTAGTPVEGAVVRVDGVSHGATGSGGTLTLADLRAGDRALTVEAPAYEAVPAVPLAVGAADLEQTITLAHPPGSVKIVARTPTGPPDDAQARFFGARTATASLPLDDRGELLLELEPGLWQAVVTAPELGMQSREVRIEPGQTAVVLVDVRLLPDAGDAALGVRVLDPAGRPVEGAEVRLDGVSVGRTTSTGTMRLAGLAAGTRTLTVTGPLLRPSEPQTFALAGDRDLDVVLAWAPGALAVHARGPDGEPVDAAIRFSGRAPMPPASLGADGEALFTLPAGDWRVALSAPTLGLQERVVTVLPDGTARIDIDASLLRAAGDAALVLAVRGPDGAAVAGAAVRVDGRDAGTVGGTGAVRLEGLAPGKHRVEVEGTEEALGSWSRELTLRSGDNPADVKLGWAERAVRVHARGPEGPVRDAVARAFGPGASPPTPLDAEGTGLVALDARAGWEIAASSPKWGLTSADVPAVAKGGGAKGGAAGGASGGAPVDLDLVFTPPPPGVARLLVELVGPDGAGVHGGTVRIGETTYPADAGYILAPTLPLGPVVVTADVPGYASATADLALVEGAQERRLRLSWLPRPLQIRVVEAARPGAPERPVDAQVRLSGPGDVRPGSTGADGAVDATVLPGAWQVLVSAPAYGARSVDALVAPGVGPVDVKVVLDAARVEVTAGAVTIDESIHFAFDEAVIQPDSFRVLEEVAAALQLHPEITRVEIQGHTDDRGEPVYNLDLSQRRAEAVRAWLLAHDVAPARLVAKGYGAAVPIAKNTTEAGRGANRRVQLVIVERSAGP